MPPYIISIDDFKEQIPGYTPEKASEFHRESAKMADKEFDRIIKQSNIGKVIFLAGGSASGKTEYLYTHLADETAIIYDSTFSHPEGAKIKIEKTRKYKKEIELHLVLPDDIKRSFDAFLGRERQFDVSVFYKTHSESRSTLLWVQDNYPNITIKIIESYYKKEHLSFREIKFTTTKKQLEYIDSIQYSIDEIISKIDL